MSRRKIVLDREMLADLYVKRNLSPYKIGDMFSCSFSTVTNRLKEYKITLKDNSTARQKFARKDFSGDTVEKAYMVGFRIGDLNVYKTKPDSKFIIARCHTTCQDQLDIIEDLFKQYGHIKVSQHADGSYHINCYLNQTFEFLLDKFGCYKEITNRGEIFSFIAGYNDAEGYMGLNQGKARFKIDSYDSEVLQWIYQHLFSFGIHGKIHIIGICKDERNFGKELWRLNINHAHDLFVFIQSTKRFARHKKRIKQMLAAENNILLRKKNGSI